MTLFEEITIKCTAEMIAARDHQTIADVVNVGRTRSQKTSIGEGTILDVLGITVGNTFLDVINSASDFRHVKRIIARGDFDVSTPTAQGGIQALVPSVLTQAQSDNLKALGIVNDHVTAARVANALDGGE